MPVAVRPKTIFTTICVAFEEAEEVIVRLKVLVHGPRDRVLALPECLGRSLMVKGEWP